MGSGVRVAVAPGKMAATEVAVGTAGIAVAGSGVSEGTAEGASVEGRGARDVERVAGVLDTVVGAGAEALHTMSKHRIVLSKSTISRSDNRFDLEK